MTPQERVRELPTPFCTVRLKPNGTAADVAKDEQSAEMWAYGTTDLFTEDQLRELADALDAAEAKLEAARVAFEAAPHDVSCRHGFSPFTGNFMPCDCWKSKLLATLKQP